MNRRATSQPYDPLPGTAGRPHPRATVRPVSGISWCVAVWAAPNVLVPGPDGVSLFRDPEAAAAWAGQRVREARAEAADPFKYSRGGENQ